MFYVLLGWREGAPRKVNFERPGGVPGVAGGGAGGVGTRGGRRNAGDFKFLRHYSTFKNSARRANALAAAFNGVVGLDDKFTFLAVANVVRMVRRVLPLSFSNVTVA